MRILNFNDGFTSETAPTQGTISSTSLKSFVDDAAYVTDKGSAASSGDTYFNTTSDLIRSYNGSSWVAAPTGDIIGPASSTDNKLPRFDGTTGKLLDSSAITVDDSGNMTGIYDLDVAGDLDVGNAATIGDDLTVNGATTTINSATVDIFAPKVTLNNSRNQVAADGNAGLVVEMSDATDVKLTYDDSLTSKFKVGESGSEEEVLTAGHTQTMTNKTLTSPVFNTQATGTAIKDEDNMASDSATHLATQQSIKAYVDANVGGSFTPSEIFVDTGNGHGSGATKVRRFTNTRKDTGSAITLTDNSTDGTYFTIDEDGQYVITYTDYRGAAVTFIAIVVNASSTTTAAASLTYANGRRGGTNAASGLQASTTWSGRLEDGDVVRAMTDGSADSTDAFCTFSITKVND